jgi:micrococcal nuclease
MSRTKRSLAGCLPLLLVFTAIGLIQQARNGAPLSARERTGQDEQLKHALSKTAAPHLEPTPPDHRDPKKLHLRVVGVHDGDTLTGLNDQKEQVKVRLDAIDAPELGQPFGRASKKALSDKVFGKDVVVTVKTKDRYGRTVGHVLIDKRDINLEMLEEGMAWHYKKYDHNKRLSEAEESARAAKKGLWQDRDPEPPWDWRKRDKPSQTRRRGDAVPSK